MGFKAKRWLMAIEVLRLSLGVRFYRAVMKQLLKKGGPYTSKRLIGLDEKIICMGGRAYRLILAWEGMLSSKSQVHRFPVKEEVLREERTA